MDKTDKPRLAEVLGVEVGEKFYIKNESGDQSPKIWIDEEGEINAYGEPPPHLYDLFNAINHPEYIIRVPRLTDSEIAIMRAMGAKWVSRDDNSVIVRLWDKQPVKCNGKYETPFLCVGTLIPRLFPSVKPGDCIELEDAQ